MFDLMDAAALKKILKERLDVDLHIHDTCGDFFMTFDEPNDTARVFIDTYAALNHLTVDWNNTHTSLRIY